MRYKEFTEAVKQSLKKKVADHGAKVEVRQIVKANDCIRDSISIIEPGRMSSPTVYLNDFYEWHQKGAAVDEISDKILKIFAHCNREVPDDFQRFELFEEAKEFITMKVLNTDINEAYLQDAVVLPYLDLSVVFYCTLIQGPHRHVFCSKITRNLMEEWGTDVQTLYALARRNTPQILGVYLKEIRDVIFEMMDDSDLGTRQNLLQALDDEDRMPMYILSNTARNSGAGNMFAEGVLEALAEQMQSDLYLIPSSIHEVLVIPVSERLSREDVDAMVEEVNCTVLRPEDILSNHVYLYEWKEDRIIM